MREEHRATCVRGGAPGPRERHAIGRDENLPLDRVVVAVGWDPLADVSRFERTWGASYLPDMEVKETPDAFVISADLPGVQEKDLDVSIAGNELCVSGKREEEARDEGNQYLAYERSYGSFCRSFTLPAGSDAENVKADLKNGVLTITVPKKAGAQSRRVQIGAKKAEAQLEAKQEKKAA